MSRLAHIPSHRKPRARAGRTVAWRAGVAGGVLGTIAVTAGATPSSATGGQAAPAETAAQPQTLTAEPPAVEQTADSLQASAAQYELEEAREQAARKAAAVAAAKKAAAERKAEAEAARRAEAAKEAEQRASRSSGRTPLAATGEATGNTARLVGFLRAQVGKAYVSGATGPSAYDCSGLVQTAFRQVGVDLPRVSQDQSAAGTDIPADQAQPGDILYWGGAGSAHHVAVYVGGGQYVDAANPSKGVVLQNVSDWPPEGARRVL